MKNYIVLFVLLIFNVLYSNGQIEFKLGDVELENELNLLNTNAKKDLEKFKSETMSDFQISSAKLNEYLEILQPAEIVLAGRIGVIVDKPVDTVISSYRSNQTKGWGEVAKDLGIKPGSPEFHALKGKPKKNQGKGNVNSNKGKGKK